MQSEPLPFQPSSARQHRAISSFCAARLAPPSSSVGLAGGCVNGEWSSPSKAEVQLGARPEPVRSDRGRHARTRPSARPSHAAEQDPSCVTLQWSPPLCALRTDFVAGRFDTGVQHCMHAAPSKRILGAKQLKVAVAAASDEELALGVGVDAHDLARVGVD